MSQQKVDPADLTSAERATFQSLVARGFSPDCAREAALDGVHVDDVRRRYPPVQSGEASS